MNLCDVCKKPCGEYSLCPDCFRLMQEGKLAICRNCGKWYLENKQCECTKRQPQYSTNAQTQSRKRPDPEETSLATRKTYRILLLFLAIVVIIILIVNISSAFSKKTNSSTNSKTQEKNETSIVTQITKTPPTVKFKSSDDLSELTQITMQIIANDNYDEVVVELQIYDENKNIITQEYLTQVNLVKGKTYNLSYNMSFTEIVNGNSARCRIYKYE